MYKGSCEVFVTLTSTHITHAQPNIAKASEQFNFIPRFIKHLAITDKNHLYHDHHLILILSTQAQPNPSKPRHAMPEKQENKRQV